jgi:hypothetical protein
LRLFRAFGDLLYRRQHVIPHAATNAAVGEADKVSAGFHPDDQVGIDVDRAEVVHQNGDAKSVAAIEDAIEQRGLAGAEKPGEHRDGSEREIGFCVVVNHVYSSP